MEQKLAVTEQQNIDMWARKELDHKHRMADMDKESDIDKVSIVSAGHKIS